MNKKIMHLENLYDFNLVRFQPNSIVLLDKNTRKPYQFYQIQHQTNLYPQLSHPSLLRPILYKNGALYAQPSSTLSSVLEFKRRDYLPNKFTSQQIINTFSPILECLDYLHQKGIAYGNLSCEHIAFFQNGEILLKDWLFRKNEKDTFARASKLKDYRDLGLLIAETATLIPQKQISKLATVELVVMLLPCYSQHFCAALIILLEGLQKYYSLVLGLARNEIPDYQISQIKAIIDEAVSLKSSREEEKNREQKQLDLKNKLLKQVQNQKQITISKKQNEQNKYQSLIQNYSIQSSPTKKFVITTPSKKIIHLQDCQNKKIFNQQIKKKQIQKITKIIQRSNAFVNQLIARKNHDKKFFNNKINTSVFDSQENCKKTTFIRESPKISSPMKRMRSISKKK